MTEPSQDPVSQCLIELEQGDELARDRLLSLIYDDLRALAGGIFRGGGAGNTLQPTVVVHEAFLRLVKPREDGGYNGRKHFFAVAAMAMRQLLANHANERRAAKRGGDREREEMHTAIAVDEGSRAIDVVDLDDALTELTKLDERLARVVELRFLSGLTVEETAEALDVSERTVQKEWQLARQWLGVRLGGGSKS